MNREDIIRMAREAMRLPEPQTPQEEAIEHALAPIFERFAALVASHERQERHEAWYKGFEAGRKAERAFCAAVCDEKEEAFKNYYVKGLPALCASAIRART